MGRDSKRCPSMFDDTRCSCDVGHQGAHVNGRTAWAYDEDEEARHAMTPPASPSTEERLRALLEPYEEWNSVDCIERDLKAAAALGAAAGYARGRAEAFEEAATFIAREVDCQGEWDDGSCEESGVTEDSDRCVPCFIEHRLRTRALAARSGGP